MEYFLKEEGLQNTWIQCIKILDKFDFSIC